MAISLTIIYIFRGVVKSKVSNDMFWARQDESIPSFQGDSTSEKEIKYIDAMAASPRSVRLEYN